MKIALTGSSSTGKTTLAKELLKNDLTKEHINNFITTDARLILQEMGHKSMDFMTQAESKIFQIKYFQKKKKLEDGANNYITDRSFVDIAAYWTIRDTSDNDKNSEESHELMNECQLLSKNYDFHFYLPFGLFPFESDGYRSEDLIFHKKIDCAIINFLQQWKVNYAVLDCISIQERISSIIDRITFLK